LVKQPQTTKTTTNDWLKRAGKWFRQHGHEADQKRLRCLSCGVHFPAQYADWVNEKRVGYLELGDENVDQ
jgi:hypothetical protein